MPTSLISFSLYGCRSMYVRGMVENAKLATKIYPGWKVRVYCETGLPTEELEYYGCEICYMGEPLEHSGMKWRFRPAWEPDIERVIFRDADSRLNVREAAAVQEWEDSGMVAHSMHDHPHHVSCPILGGMWGIKGGFLPTSLLQELEKEYSVHNKKGDDTWTMTSKVFPLVKHSLMTHSAYVMNDRSAHSRELVIPARPFPKHSPWTGFCGQQVDDNMQPMWAGLKPVERTGLEEPILSMP